MQSIKPVLEAGVIYAHVPDGNGRGRTQLVFQVHRDAHGQRPVVTVSAMDRRSSEGAALARQAVQTAREWLLAPENTGLIVHLDGLRRAEAVTPAG
jgi:hypothetical protein